MWSKGWGVGERSVGVDACGTDSERVKVVQYSWRTKYLYSIIGSVGREKHEEMELKENYDFMGEGNRDALCQVEMKGEEGQEQAKSYETKRNRKCKRQQVAFLYFTPP